MCVSRRNYTKNNEKPSVNSKTTLLRWNFVRNTVLAMCMAEQAYKIKKAPYSANIRKIQQKFAKSVKSSVFPQKYSPWLPTELLQGMDNVTEICV